LDDVTHKQVGEANIT